MESLRSRRMEMRLLALPLMVGGFLLALSACTAKREIDQTQHSQTEQSGSTPQSSESFLPDDSGAVAGPFALGRRACNAGQYERAIVEFERAVQQDADNSDYHWWLARAYGQRVLQVRSGEQFFLARKVKAHLERAVELNPDNIAARFDLLQYHLQAPGFLGGSLEEANRQAEEIVRRDAQQGQLAHHLCEQAESTTPAPEILK